MPPKAFLLARTASPSCAIRRWSIRPRDAIPSQTQPAQQLTAGAVTDNHILFQHICQEYITKTPVSTNASGKRKFDSIHYSAHPRPGTTMAYPIKGRRYTILYPGPEGPICKRLQGDGNGPRSLPAPISPLANIVNRLRRKNLYLHPHDFFIRRHHLATNRHHRLERHICTLNRYKRLSHIR